MEQRERDESSSKLEEALRELTGAETTGKIEEYENEREGADVDSETACTDMKRAERMPVWIAQRGYTIHCGRPRP